MIKQPAIQLQRTILQRILDFLVLGALCFYWVSVINVYPTLPDLIPTHFGLDGIPDTFGSRNSIFLLPIIATVLVILMTTLSFMPHLFSYPVRVDRTNAQKQYSMAVSYLLLTQLIVIILFILIDYHTVLVVFDKGNKINPYCIPFLIVALFIPSVFHYFRSKRVKAIKLSK